MNIPAPNQAYDSYHYTNLRSQFGVGTSADYGYHETSSYADAAAVENYKNNVLLPYIQQAQTLLSQLQNGDPRRQELESYLQQAYQYAEEVGLEVQRSPGLGNEWDPLAGSVGGYAGATPSYQDANKMIYEDMLPAMTADKQSLKEEHFYAPPYDFTIPGSATADVSNEVDPNHPDKTRVCVTVTWPNGTVKKHYFYNVDWKENALILRSTAPDHQINIHESAANIPNIKTAEIGEEVKTAEEVAEEEKELEAVNPEAPTDNTPSLLSEDGKTATYDKETDPIITVYPDGPENNEIIASGVFTLNSYKQSDQFIVDYTDGGEYFVITVKTNNNKGEAKTITYKVKAEQIDQIILAGVDDSQITYNINTRGKPWGEVREKGIATKLTNEAGETDLIYQVNWNFSATNDGIAHISENNPNITVDPNGPGTTNIDATGTLTLKANKPTDTFEIDSDGATYTITVKTTDASGKERVLIYVVEPNQIGKVKIAGVDSSQVHVKAWHGSSLPAVFKAEHKVAKAKANLEKAQAAYENTTSEDLDALSEAQAALANAQTELDAAESDLADAQKAAEENPAIDASDEAKALVEKIEIENGGEADVTWR